MSVVHTAVSPLSPPATDAEHCDITAGPANDDPAPACADSCRSDHPDAVDDAHAHHVSTNACTSHVYPQSLAAIHNLYSVYCILTVMLCSDWPSVVGAPASDPEDGLSGSDHTETGRDTGSVDRTEPDGHHDPHCTHPDHRTAGSCKSHDINRHYSTLTTMIGCQIYQYLKEVSINFLFSI